MEGNGILGRDQQVGISPSGGSLLDFRVPNIHSAAPCTSGCNTATFMWETIYGPKSSRVLISGLFEVLYTILNHSGNLGPASTLLHYPNAELTGYCVLSSALNVESQNFIQQMSMSKRGGGWPAQKGPPTFGNPKPKSIMCVYIPHTYNALTPQEKPLVPEAP